MFYLKLKQTNPAPNHQFSICGPPNKRKLMAGEPSAYLLTNNTNLIFPDIFTMKF